MIALANGTKVICKQPPQNHRQSICYGVVLYKIKYSDCYAVDVAGQTLVFDSSYLEVQS